MTRYQFNCTSSYMEAWIHCKQQGYAFWSSETLKAIEVDESKEELSEWSKYRLDSIVEEDVRMLDM